MGFYQKFLEGLEQAAYGRFKNPKRLADHLGVEPNLITRWLKKERVPKADKMGEVLDALGAFLSFPDESPQEQTREICFVDAKIAPSGRALPLPDAELYVAVPLADEAGAGPGMMPQDEFKSWVLVHRHMPSISRRSNLIAVEIAKNSRSMTPLLHPGDIVLVDLDDWGQEGYRSPGNIFLVREPGQEGGGKIKRVTMSGKGHNASIIYYSENAAENEPESYFIGQDFDGEVRKAIVGKVVWAWTDLSRK